MSFNVTLKAEDRKALSAGLTEQAKSQLESGHLTQEAFGAIEALVDSLPNLKNGYYQLTTYGHLNKTGPSNIIFNLSSHANE